MFPGVYGFTWSAGNLIFLGLFFTIAVIIATTLVLASLRAWQGQRAGRAQAIRWHEDFHNLPAPLKACRHELNGDIQQRACPNAFECRTCAIHAQYLARQENNVERPATAETPFGFDYPADRLYHRGHAWVEPDADGTVLVGLDDFGKKVFGTVDAVELPPVGTHLEVNGTGWTMRRHGHAVRILAPIDGEVVAHGAAEDGWIMRVRPSTSGFSTNHLLAGSEVRGWITREIDNLQIRLGGSHVGPALADGGEVIEEIPASYPTADWDAIWGNVFLEP